MADNPRLGLVLPFNADLTDLSLPDIGDSDRQWIADFAAERLSMSAIVQSYKNLYLEISAADVDALCI
jgi:hypothetical protein